MVLVPIKMNAQGVFTKLELKDKIRFGSYLDENNKRITYC